MSDRKGGDKMKNKNFGFTLVELLVVIAIIGILSSVAIINLQSAKDKATQANVQSALSQLIPAVIVCLDDQEHIECTAGSDCDPTVAGDGTPIAGQALCPGASATWPTLETGWSYTDTATSTLTSNPTWAFGAQEGAVAGDRYVSCSQTGCVADIR